jgi:flagellar basal body-associated protein FliL
MYNTNSSNNETSFADAYKSEILNKDDDNDDPSKNLIIILALVAVILGLIIFGYIYIFQTDTQPTKVEEEKQEIVEPAKSNMLNNIDELELGEGKSDSVEEIKEDTKDKKKVDKKSDTYLEQLADLSHEIDGGKKKK